MDQSDLRWGLGGVKQICMGSAFWQVYVCCLSDRFADFWLNLCYISFDRLRAGVEWITQRNLGMAGEMNHTRTYRHKGKIHWAPQGHLAVILHRCSYGGVQILGATVGMVAMIPRLCGATLKMHRGADHRFHVYYEQRTLPLGFVGCFTWQQCRWYFRSETWNLPTLTIKCLEGFHLRVAWHIGGMQPCKMPDRTWTWTHPSLEEVLEKVGMYRVRD